MLIMTSKKQTGFGTANSDSQGGNSDDEQKSSNLSANALSKKKSSTSQKTSKSKKTNDRIDEIDLDEYSLGGLKYKLPGKNQRVIIASLVIGLNLLLLAAVFLYFNNSAFHDFVFNVGKS